MKKRISIAMTLFFMTLSFCALAQGRCYGLYKGENVGAKEIDKVRALYGSSPCLVLSFYDSTWLPSSEYLLSLREEGVVPVVTIEPWTAATGVSFTPNDDYISKLAEALNEYNAEVYIRYAHEMNGNWYPWGGDPKRYVASYISFHDALSSLLRNNNVKWIWSVNNESVPDTAKNNVLLYYPGDKYVDAVGIDGYLREPSWIKRAYLSAREIFLRRGTFSYLFGSTITELKKIDKPILITETAIASNDDFKGAAIKSFFKDLENDYPYISNFIWFDVNKEADWRVVSGVIGLAYFKNGIKDWQAYDKTRTH